MAAAALLASLAGCGAWDDGPVVTDPPDGTAPADPLGELRWDLPAVAPDLTVCGEVAVMGPLAGPPEVVDVEAERFVVPEVVVPDDATLLPTSEWNARGRCQDTREGPVVVVEYQEQYSDFTNVPPTVYAGFAPDGAQLWTREEPGNTFGSYAGRDAFVIEDRDTEQLTVVDTRTGTTVADGLTGLQPATALSTSEIVDGDGDLLGLPDGEQVAALGPAWADAGEGRVLRGSGRGVELLGLPGAERVWLARGVALSLIENPVVDHTTGVVVVTGRDDRYRGLDLGTGRQVWVSDLRTNSYGIGSIGSGLAVLPAEAGGGQVLLDTATGEVLPDPPGYVVASSTFVLLVEDQVPRAVTVDELR